MEKTNYVNSFILAKSTFSSTFSSWKSLESFISGRPVFFFETQEAAWKGERIQQVVTGAAGKHYSGLHGIARNCSTILGLRGEFWPPKRAKCGLMPVEWIRWSKANPAKVRSAKSVGKTLGLWIRKSHLCNFVEVFWHLLLCILSMFGKHDFQSPLRKAKQGMVMLTWVVCSCILQNEIDSLPDKHTTQPVEMPRGSGLCAWWEWYEIWLYLHVWQKPHKTMDCHLRHSRFVMVCLKSVMTRSWCAGHPICDRHFNECKATERESQRTTGISRQSAVYTPYMYRCITDPKKLCVAASCVPLLCFFSCRLESDQWYQRFPGWWLHPRKLCRGGVHCATGCVPDAPALKILYREKLL